MVVRSGRPSPAIAGEEESALTPEQLGGVRDLLRDWRSGGDPRGPRPNASPLENGMWIMVGTSARIGEVLIAATITQTRAEAFAENPPRNEPGRKQC